MKSRKILPPTYLLMAIIVVVILHFLLPMVKIIIVPWNIFGIIPLACGIAINIFADRTFQPASSRKFQSVGRLLASP